MGIKKEWHAHGRHSPPPKFHSKKLPEKPTRTMKSDIISGVIYFAINGAALSRETADRCFISGDEGNYKQTLRVSSLGRSTLWWYKAAHRAHVLFMWECVSAHTACRCAVNVWIYLRVFDVLCFTVWRVESTCGTKISIGVLINYKKNPVNHYSSLISLEADSSDSLQHLRVTFLKLKLTWLIPRSGELSIRATNWHDLHKMCIRKCILSFI